MVDGFIDGYDVGFCDGFKVGIIVGKIVGKGEGFRLGAVGADVGYEEGLKPLQIFTSSVYKTI